MKAFGLKAINLLLVVGLLVGYNQFISVKTESYEAQVAEIEAQNEETIQANQAIMASADASGDSEENATYADGTYTGTGLGFGGDITVEVTIADGQMTEITIVSADSEDAAYFDMAVDIIDDMLEAQTSDVDTISGATFSSTGIKDAVEDALSQAVE